MTRYHAVAAGLMLLAAPIGAQETVTAAASGGAAGNAAELAKQLSNPISSLVSVPFQSNWDFGVGPYEKERFILNFQPVMPFSLNEDWNLIARVILPLVSQPSLGEGIEPRFGTSDIVTSFFLSPAGSGAVTWGVGPVLLVPTTSDPFLGSGRWGAGPTGVILKQSGPLTYGALVNHIWSYGGDDTRADVNQTFLQPFFAYGTRSGWTYTLQTETTANWEAEDGQKWTVPVNFIVSKVTRLGRRPISFAAGPGVYLEKPDGGPRWRLRVAVTLLFPR